MKNLFVAILIICSSAVLMAQTDEQATDNTEKSNYEIKTLAGNNSKMAHGGYFALNTHYTMIDGKDAFMVGTRFGYLMNHKFFIGFGGTGFVNDIKFTNFTDGEDAYLQGGYGGLYLEPIIGGKSVVHVTLPILIGGGGMVYSNHGFYDNLHDDYNHDFDHYHDWEEIDTDVFFVIEPGVNLEINVTKFFRIGLEGKYRYVNGLELINTDENMLNGWSAGLNLKFGKF